MPQMFKSVGSEYQLRVPKSKRQSHISPKGEVWLFFLKKSKKEEESMRKASDFATNKGGVIKAPRPVKDSPKANVTKGNDLRNGKSK